MSGAKIGRYFALALRCLLGAVFLYAGSVKISRTQDFAYDVNSYQLTSWTTAILIAVYLPWVEIFTGMALLARQLYLGALAIAAALAAVFLTAILSAWQRGLDITCGCFAPEVNRTNYPVHMALDLAMLVVATALLVYEFRRNRT